MLKKQNIKSIAFIFAVCVFFAGAVRGQESSETVQSKKERIEAERVWEQMVKVRGGRDKLHSISNILLTKGINADSVQIELYVYPNRYWEWSRNKALRDSLWITMANLDTGVFVVVEHETLVANRHKLSEAERTNYRESYLIAACRFLLETKWLRPTPIRVTRKKLGKEQVDVVETRFTTLSEYKNWRVDFYIDPESLVVKGVENYGDDEIAGRYTSFQGYTTVEGIDVPQKFGVSLSIKDFSKIYYSSLSFRFNVDYDKRLFETSPSMNAGPDAWKSKN